MQDTTVISFIDSDARMWLVQKTAERTLQLGRQVQLSEVARRVFALGRALVERKPNLLDDGKGHADA